MRLDPISIRFRSTRKGYRVRGEGCLFLRSIGRSCWGPEEREPVYVTREMGGRLRLVPMRVACPKSGRPVMHRGHRMPVVRV